MYLLLLNEGGGGGGGGSVISGWAYKRNKKMFLNDEIKRVWETN